jgi:ABC-type polysaccharide/polyol phosphate transport system ATPase subunit
MVKQAGTVVIVSHSFGMMAEVCGRLILLDKGRIIAEGNPKDVIAAYHGNNKNSKA